MKELILIFEVAGVSCLGVGALIALCVWIIDSIWS